MGQPGVTFTREQLVGLRGTIESTFEQDYVLWVVTWLDIEKIPAPGHDKAWDQGELKMHARTEDASSSGPGQVLAQFGLSGAIKDAVSSELQAQSLFGDLLEGELRPTDRASWEVKVQMDPSALIPVRATIDRELVGLRDGTRVSASSTSTTEFVPIAEAE